MLARHSGMTAGEKSRSKAYDFPEMLIIFSGHVLVDLQRMNNARSKIKGHLVAAAGLLLGVVWQVHCARTTLWMRQEARYGCRS